MINLPQIPIDKPLCVNFAYHGDKYGCDCPKIQSGKCDFAYSDDKNLTSCTEFKRVYRKGERELETIKKPPSKHKCKYFGEELDEKVLCNTCKGKVELKVFECGIHGKCTLGKDGELHGCLGNGSGCKDKVDKIPDVYEIAKELNQYKEPEPHKMGWPSEEMIKKAHQIALDSFILNLEDYPQDKYSGKGIVVVGGGKYWASAWVSVNMIKYIGCKLPIQVWYLGKEEENFQIQSLLENMGVTCIDALSLPKTYRNLTGFYDSQRGGNHPPFQLKSFAALNSSYEEVLILDADNYPCQDPTILFDEPGYKATGGIFWPDLPHTNEWTKWDFFDVKKFGQECGLEVGQYLYNKKIAWKQLNVARWLDDHGDWCYGWGHYGDHGDKGPHRIAWAKLEKEYTMYSTNATWKQPAFLQVGPNKKPMFVHRCKSKFVLDDTQSFSSTPNQSFNQKGNLPLEGKAFELLAELRRLLK